MVQDLVPGGTFLFNTQWTVDELDEKLPGQVKRYIAENNINFYIIDGVKIGKEIRYVERIGECPKRKWEIVTPPDFLES